MESKPYADTLDRDILAAMTRPSRAYWVALTLASATFAVGLACWGWQMYEGLGVDGITHPVGWGVFITDFVFWVGIAHSGTLISAVLFLFRARFRSSFNRSAEAMTVISAPRRLQVSLLADGVL